MPIFVTCEQNFTSKFLQVRGKEKEPRAIFEQNQQMEKFVRLFLTQACFSSTDSSDGKIG